MKHLFQVKYMNGLAKVLLSIQHFPWMVLSILKKIFKPSRVVLISTPFEEIIRPLVT